MYIYIEDENSGGTTNEIIKCGDNSFSINTINWFSPTFYLFKNMHEMFKQFPHLEKFKKEIEKSVYNSPYRIGLQYFWSNNKRENVFSHFWS